MKSILVFLLLMLPIAALAQSSQTWGDLAIQAQKNATVDQMTAAQMISALQAENAALKAEIAKLNASKEDHLPVPEPPK